MFSNIEITLKFFVNHDKSQKLYFDHTFLHNRKNMSYKDTSDKNLFQNKVLHLNTGEMKLA